MDDTARIYEIAHQFRFWMNSILLIVAFVLAASARGSRGKVWLLLGLAGLLLVPVGWYARNLLERFTHIDDALAILSIVLLQLADVVVTGAILVFVIVWRSKPTGVTSPA